MDAKIKRSYALSLNQPIGHLIDSLRTSSMLKPDFNVLELSCKCADSRRNELLFNKAAEIESNKSFDILNHQDLYYKLGAYSYVFIDLGSPDRPPYFNFDHDFTSLFGIQGGYDLVINYGAQDLIPNQISILRNIHNLSSLGGIIVHMLELENAGSSSPRNLSTDFLFGAARLNNYEILGVFDVADLANIIFDENLMSPKTPKCRDAEMIVAVFRRAGTGDFMWVEENSTRTIPSIASSSLVAYESLNTEDGFFRISDHSTGERNVIKSLAAGPGWNGSGDPFEYHTEAAICALSEAVAAIYGFDVPGDIVEFGTMSGRTAVGIARAINSCDKYLNYTIPIYAHGIRNLYLFDSFRGLPAVDVDSVDASSPHVKTGIWGAGTLRGVSPEELSSMIVPYLSQDRVKIIDGWFNETISLIPPETRFAMIHVDCDLYSSTMDVLDSLFSRNMISPGAYIFFDDWNCNGASPHLGERRAWREMVQRYKIDFSDQRAYAIFSRCFVVHSYHSD